MGAALHNLSGFAGARTSQRRRRLIARPQFVMHNGLPPYGGRPIFCASWIQLQARPVWLATLRSRLFIRSPARFVAVQLSRERMVSPVATVGARHGCSARINLSAGGAVRLHWSKSRRQHRKTFVVIAVMKFPS